MKTSNIPGVHSKMNRSHKINDSPQDLLKIIRGVTPLHLINISELTKYFPKQDRGELSGARPKLRALVF